MRSDKIQTGTWREDQHPSTELLRQYEEGILSAALSNELERHLMDCELCEDILTGMTLVDRSRTEQAKTRILQRLRNRLRKSRRRAPALHGLGDWRVAAAVLMMFCSLGLLLFYHYTQSVSEEKAALLASENQPPSPEELLARTIDSALVLDIQAPPPAAIYKLPVVSSQPERVFQEDAQTVAEQMVSGRVYNTNGDGLSAVRVLVKGTALGGTTDAAGNFSIQVPPSRDTLVFTAPGYRTVEVKLDKSATPLHVQLQEGAF